MISKKKTQRGGTLKRRSICPTKKSVEDCNSDEICRWNRIKSRCYKKSKRQLKSNVNTLSGRYVRSICPTKKNFKECDLDDLCRWNRGKEKCYKKFVPGNMLTYIIPGFYRTFKNSTDLERFIDLLDYYYLIYYVIDEEQNQILVEDQILNITNLTIIPEKYRLDRLRKMPIFFKEHDIPFEIRQPNQMQTDTPRRAYYKKYNQKNPVLLPNKQLFQITFNDPDQFINYTQITSNTSFECFIQTLFSLGLRDVKEGKKDVVKLQKKKFRGVKFVEAAKYFETSFGLRPGQIQYNELPFEYAGLMDDFFENLLENNCATIFSLIYRMNDSTIFGHFMIVYKLNDELFFFDPQLNVHYENLSHVQYTFEVERDQEILFYGYFETNNITQPIELKNNSCPINFYHGGYNNHKLFQNI
jgi:hypothetical protein